MQRYLRDDLSIAEAKELFDFIAMKPEQAHLLLNEDNSKAFEEKFHTEAILPESISTRMYERFLQEIRKSNIAQEVTPGIESANRKVHFLRSHKWWAAAAAIFLLFGTSAYFLFQSSPKPVQIASVGSKKISPDVMPGKNGAVLTLADGTSIVLDSLGNGIIAKQGKTEVKLKDGQLLYDKGSGKLQQADKIAYNTMTTPKGRQYRLVLSDGTKVWLNAASSLKYPTVFTGTERKVEITGEAYFEVAKNAKMPFKVNINHTTTVEVLGTHFNINAYSDEESINTTLLEGSVKIKADNKIQMLEPGQQARVNSKAGSIKLVKNVDLDQVVAWKNGAFSFADTDLPAVMRQLERWYNVDVVYAGAVPSAKFNGEIGKSLTLSQVLKLLAQTRIKYKIENGNKIIILPDK